MEHERRTLESLTAGTGVAAPKQPHRSRRKIRPTPAGGYKHADARGLELGGCISLNVVVGIKPDKRAQFAPCKKNVILPMDWQQGDVKMDNEQHKQFDLGE